VINIRTSTRPIASTMTALWCARTTIENTAWRRLVRMLSRSARRCSRKGTPGTWLPIDRASCV
jgi:hypothetical protein